MVTLVTSRSRPKEFAWSYTKLKNWRTCPKRYYEVDVAKTYKESDDNEHLKYGNFVHEALANRINAEHTPLPPTIRKFDKWATKILAGQHDTILVEQQLAITESLRPTSWFGSEAWYRGVADVIKKSGPVALVIDWKTGKILEDGVQLALMAQCVFAHHPEVQHIRTEFIWLKEDATTRADFQRNDMAELWAKLLPEVNRLKIATEKNDFPPTPNGLCRKFCVVKSCPHHGVG